MKWHLSRFITTTIWISIISLTLPWTPYFCLVQTGGEDLHISTDVWPTEEIETTYFMFVSQYPVFIIMLRYFLTYFLPANSGLSKLAQLIIPDVNNYFVLFLYLDESIEKRNTR
ncbi:hypothetical protein AVEN_140087-1 [Araneus ventricosus]|uniref:Uncharacterized protein n=1 Tax=Araneus ventricosus TaxID=182803 RepID=A0A4Y2QS76_ARAVE|nr:hypothetical protein AVEN_140087-1 [Araneus ventricosus]